MTTIWLISDTHFGHANILTFIDEHGGLLRPGFANVEEMDEHTVKCWNSVVKPQDHVYHLGDAVIKAPSLSIIKRLNGHKRLVRGNHDIFKTKQYIQAGFEEIYGVRMFDGLVLSHIPLHPDHLRKRCNVHGHLHINQVMYQQFGCKPDRDPRYLNVSVERLDYIPITLEAAREMLAKQ